METITINLWQILKLVVIILAIFGGYSLLSNLLEKIKDIYNKKKDSEITALALSKENSHEIHNLNVRLQQLEELVRRAYN